MGRGDQDDHEYQKKQAHHQNQTHNKFKIKMLLLVVFSNLLTIYLFTAGPFASFKPLSLSHHINLEQDQDLACRDLQEELNSTRVELSSTSSLVERLLVELGRVSDLTTSQLSKILEGGNNVVDSNSGSDSDVVSTVVSRIDNEEVKLAVGPHKLPLGYTPRSGSDEVYPSVGGGCLSFQEDLAKYMTYKVGGECPMDDVFAQRLILKGCEPLPRRRCHPKSPVGYTEPTKFPESLWVTPPDTSIVWDPYTCKNYQCLIDRKKIPGFYDCKDCFDLQGREKSRWLVDNGALIYGIDQVLATKPGGTIRIGMDIGGGSGTFAARMRERNVTIITSSMNLDGPFNNFIASRGLISIHVSVSQRLPFFDNTLDIVHSMHVLSNWIPDSMLEFTLYDIYRVLRPGGLFWVDHFFCIGSQLNRTYIPMFSRIGFNQLRWNEGMKLDRGAQMDEWYFSALLEKPMT